MLSNAHMCNTIQFMVFGLNNCIFKIFFFMIGYYNFEEYKYMQVENKGQIQIQIIWG